jgi:large subunit ribosomal protein L25
MAEVLSVKVRESRGTSRARRQRAAGQIPAILYGHGQESVSLSVPTEQVLGVVRHGGHIVQLEGDVSDTALVRAVQWDPFGVDVLHIDLARVRPTRRCGSTWWSSSKAPPREPRKVA